MTLHRGTCKICGGAFFGEREEDLCDAHEHREPEPTGEPCPYCFESSGYEARYIPATWYEPAWEDTDYGRPCEHCNGTGVFEAKPRSAPAQIEAEEIPF